MVIGYHGGVLVIRGPFVVERIAVLHWSTADSWSHYSIAGSVALGAVVGSDGMEDVVPLDDGRLYLTNQQLIFLTERQMRALLMHLELMFVQERADVASELVDMRKEPPYSDTFRR